MSDSDDSDVPGMEIDMSIVPYKFEPERRTLDDVIRPDSESSETESDDDQDDQARARDSRTDNDACMSFLSSHCYLFVNT